MTNIPTNAISFNLYYGGKSVSEMMEEGGISGSDELLPVTEETPQFKNISIQRITLKGAKQAVFLQGLPEMNLKNVVLKDMLLEAEKGFTVIDADEVNIKNVNIKTKNKTAFEFLNSRNINMTEIEFSSEAPDVITINGNKSQNISIVSSEKNDFQKQTKIGSDVPQNAVKF